MHLKDRQDMQHYIVKQLSPVRKSCSMPMAAPSGEAAEPGTTHRLGYISSLRCTRWLNW